MREPRSIATRVPIAIYLQRPEIRIDLVRYRFAQRVDHSTIRSPRNRRSQPCSRKQRQRLARLHVYSFQLAPDKRHARRKFSAHESEVFSIRRPYRRTEYILPASNHLPRLGAIRPCQPDLLIERNILERNRRSQVSDRRAIRRYRGPCSLRHELPRRPTHQRDFPDALRLAGPASPRCQKMSSVWKPALRPGNEATGHADRVRLSRIDLSQIKAAGIGKRKILAIRRNHSIDDRQLRSIRGQPSLTDVAFNASRGGMGDVEADDHSHQKGKGEPTEEPPAARPVNRCSRRWRRN